MGILRTVTLNTGYDDYYSVSDMHWGGLGRMHQFHSVCSGKGVSCARTAHALGLPTKAYALVGEADLAHYSSSLAAEGIDHHLVAVDGRTRHNLTLVDATGEHVAAHFVAAGFTLEPEAVDPLVEAVLADVQPGDVVTLNGSTPHGLPDQTWADLARFLIRRGARVIVDAQKAAFRSALDIDGITAFKPNDEEIRELPGLGDLPTDERVEQALRMFAAAGVQIPLVSMGADGLRWWRDGAVVAMDCPVERPMQSVMAGDALVAGIAWGLLEGRGDEDALRHGLAAAAAHVEGLTGHALGERARARIRDVRVRPVSR